MFVNLSSLLEISPFGGAKDRISHVIIDNMLNIEIRPYTRQHQLRGVGRDSNASENH